VESEGSGVGSKKEDEGSGGATVRGGEEG